jgi:hypothetical protein
MPSSLMSSSFTLLVKSLVHRTVGNCWPRDTASHPRWLECSSCCDLHVLLKFGYCENFRAIRHLNITLVLCYKFGLSVTVRWLLLNKSQWQHSSRVNITSMYHPVQEQLSMSVILGPSRLLFLFRVTWHTTAHTHLTATFTLSFLLFIWETLLLVLCVYSELRQWSGTATVSSICQASFQTVKYHIAYNPCFRHSVVYNISNCTTVATFCSDSTLISHWLQYTQHYCSYILFRKHSYFPLTAVHTVLL